MAAIPESLAAAEQTEQQVMAAARRYVEAQLGEETDEHGLTYIKAVVTFTVKNRDYRVPTLPLIRELGGEVVTRASYPSLAYYCRPREEDG
jgi:hypothetical protein